MRIRSLVYICLLAVTTTAVSCSSCRGGGGGSDTNNGKKNANGSATSPENSKRGPENPATTNDTVMIIEVKQDVSLKPKGASEFVRILRGPFHLGDILQVGENSFAMVLCDVNVCSLRKGVYTECCKGTCDDMIRLQPTGGENSTRAFMKKADLPPDQLVALNTEEAKIRNLGTDEVTTQFLIANLYSSWKLVEANQELDSLSQKLNRPEAAKELNTLYSPMVRKTGDLYLKINQKAAAEKTYLKGLELTPVTNDKQEKAATHVSLGQLYEESGKKEQAVENFQKGKQLYEQQGNIKKAAEVRRAIVDVQKK